MNIALLIGIPIVVLLAAITVLASARRRATDAQGRVTGTLTAETKASDAGTALATTTDDASAEARARGQETRSGASGVAKRASSGAATVNGL